MAAGVVGIEGYDSSAVSAGGSGTAASEIVTGRDLSTTMLFSSGSAEPEGIALFAMGAE
jgi:hypothetical protein